MERRNVKILETIILAKCDNGKVYQVAGEVFCPNVIDTPIARVEVSNGLEIIPEGNKDKVADPADVLKIVCEYFGKTVSEVLRRDRRAEIVLIRHLAIYFIRIKTTLGLKRIGKLFQGMDHSTVIFATRKITGLIQVDEGVAKYASELTKLLAPFSDMNYTPHLIKKAKPIIKAVNHLKIVEKVPAIYSNQESLYANAK